MRQSAPNTLKLPKSLLDELGTSENDHNGSRKRRSGPKNRKEQRKAARVQKKSSHVAAHVARVSKHRSNLGDGREIPKSFVTVLQPRTEVLQKVPKSILKVPKSIQSAKEAQKDFKSLSEPPPAKVSRRVQEQLAADDAEIEALEKALGVKGKKKLPESFEIDGLCGLLDGIDDAVSSDEAGSGKRKRSENKEWLKTKRQKGQERSVAAGASVDIEKSDNENDEDSGDPEPRELSEGKSDSDEQSDIDEDDGSASLEEEDDYPSTSSPVRKPRENPYVAPVTVSSALKEGKYRPPSLRDKGLGASEDLSRLRRQMQGLLNRLSEANLLSILNSVEQLYRDHPRQFVSTTLLDLLLGLLSDPTSLDDTFIILHAGFIAAIYRVSGTDFGAQAIQRITEEFFLYYDTKADQHSSGKKLNNLTSLLAELYNFQVISSNLIYGFVRLFLDNLSEIDTELLLKVVRNAGLQLRQDDPTSLKDIVVQLQNAVAQKGEENLSIRTKFMVETMNNLKDNRMKTGITASTITSEHIVRMKRILGSLNQRTIRASEPLRVGLRDLQDINKRGKWWLIGASYKDDSGNMDDRPKPSHVSQGENEDDLVKLDLAADLAQLAREQRMNTDVRRSIFIAIMSSSDSNDAYIRLMKLGLKKSQKLEIPKVLIHCAGAEKTYNPFYTFLSRRVCSDKRLKMAFQFSLWDFLKGMGEREDEEEEAQEGNFEGGLGLRSIVNLASMFGVLVAEGGLSVGVLKNLDLAYLQTKIRTFVELMLITAIVHSQQDYGENRNEKALMDIFLKPKEISEMAAGLRYFLRKVVSKTDVAGNRLDKETVKWGCKVVSDALSVMAAQTVSNE